MANTDVSNKVGVSEKAFLNESTITKVNFGKNCVYVSNQAFANCTSLSTINNDNVIEEIGSEAFARTIITYASFGRVNTIASKAFEGCEELTNININENCSYIGQEAFDGCKSLTNIKIPTNTSFNIINERTFQNCIGLKNITIPSNVTTIGSYAFNCCSGLTSVSFKTQGDKGVQNIGDGAFHECTSLTKVTIPDTTTTIGDNAFANCNSITSVKIGKNITTIGSNAFNNCNNLKTVEFECKTINSWFSKNETIEKVYTSDTVKTIGYGAFYECGKLTDVSIGIGVNTIEGEAFNGCSSLVSIKIPKNVKSIGKWSFARCSNLANITIENGVECIGEGAFLNCNKLKNVYTNDIASWCNIDFTDTDSNPLHVGGNLCLNNDPDTKLNITLPSDGVKKYAFYNCKNISNITIPNKFTSDKFGTEAFHGVVDHRVINLSNTTVSKTHGENGCVGEGAQEIINAYNGEIQDDIFVFGQKSQNVNSDWALFKYLGTEEIYNSKYKDGLILPDKYYTYDINEGVFKDHKEIKNITIPTDVTSIGNNTFTGCYNLNTLTIEGYDYDNSDSEIGDAEPVIYNETYESESDIEPDLILGYNIKSSNNNVGEGLFKNCNLKTLNLGRNISYNANKEYGYSPFCGISSLTTVNIGDDVTNINENMFYNCRNINSVNIGNSVTTIGSSAFHYCSNLTSITIPNSVTSIEKLAFSNCSLTGGVYINNLTAWCNIDFKYKSDADVYIKYDSNPLCKSGGKLYLNGNLVNGDIVIPNGVRNIGFCTFYGCGIKSVTIPDGVESIGESAFNSCNNLTSVTLGNNVNSIGNDAFANCGNIKIYINGSTIPDSWYNIEFKNGGSNPASISHGLYNKENEGNETTDEPIKNIIIPNTVDNIKSYAFYNFTHTKNIIIPNSVTSIGNNAFQNCGNMYDNDNNINIIKRIVIGNGVTTIGEGAFKDLGKINVLIIGKKCDELTFENFNYQPYNDYISVVINFSENNKNIKNKFSISYPDNKLYAEQYEDFMFDKINDDYTLCGYMGAGVGTLKLPNDYNGYKYEVGKYAFCNCDMLESIIIPKNVTGIANDVVEHINNSTNDFVIHPYGSFHGCDSLTSIVVESGNAKYDSRDNCNAIIEKDTNTLIIGCKNTRIPDSVTTIGDTAFYNCKGLTSITIPNNVTTIGKCAFYNCKDLTSVIIGKSVTSIEDWAFKGCEKLNTVINYSSLDIIPRSETNGYVGFYAKEIITKEVVVEDGFMFETVDGVNILTQYVGDPNVEEINFPKTYKDDETYVIGDYVFYHSEYIPNDIIKRITIPNSVTKIGTQAFYYCAGLTNIVIPNSVENIGDWAFKGCENLNTVINLSKLKIGKNDENGYVGNYANNIINYTDAYIEGDFGWVEIEGTNILVAYIGNDKELTLPIDYKGKEYVIGEFVFENYTSLTKVTIPNAVTSIGNKAFYGCTNLNTVINYSSSFTIENDESNGCVGKYAETITNITNDSYKDFVFEKTDDGVNILKGYKDGLTIPEELKLPETYYGKNYVIGDNAFKGCSSLISVTIPNSVTSIGNGAFDNCTSLKDLHMEDGETTLSLGCNYYYKYDIGEGLFYDCPIESLYLGRNIQYETNKEYGYSPFYGKKSLKSVTIGNSVTSIGESVFDGCSGLISVTIPNSVISIGIGAFYNCESLTTITIPNSVTSIGGEALEGTAWYNSQPDGVVYAGKVLYKYKGEMPIDASINIEEDTLVIADYAFRDCNNLTSVTIPNSVTHIGEGVFDSCDNLVSVIIGNGVTNIGDYVFNECINLKTVINLSGLNIIDYVGDNVNVIKLSSAATNISIEGDFVWAKINGNNTLCVYIGDDTNATELGLPENYKGENYVIGDKAFEDCSSLISVTIPNSVTSIGDYAFKGCYIDNSNTGIKNVKIGNGVTTIGKEAFYNCGVLESVTFVENSKVETIGDYAFYNCNLNKIEIPNSVTNIGNYAFKDCDNIETVTIGNNVETIGECAFDGCKFIGFNSDDITDIIIPASVTKIGIGAFKNCPYIKSIAVENNNSIYYSKNNAIIERATNTLIQGCEYNNTSGVTHIPEVNIIGESAFDGYNNTNFVKIQIPSSVNSIEKFAFRNCSVKEITFMGDGTNLTIGEDSFPYVNNGITIYVPINCIQKYEGIFKYYKEEWGYSIKTK